VSDQAIIQHILNLTFNLIFQIRCIMVRSNRYKPGFGYRWNRMSARPWGWLIDLTCKYFCISMKQMLDFRVSEK
jgi:hypothetical protein